MKSFLLIGSALALLLSSVNVQAQSNNQLLEKAAAQVKQQDYCAAAASFEQALADSTQVGPFDLYAGATAAARCPGHAGQALGWLHRLPRRANLSVTAQDVDNMAQDNALVSLHDRPEWTSFLGRMRAVAAARQAADQQAAATWVAAAESRALRTPIAGKSLATVLPGGALYYAPVDTVREPYLVYVPRSYRPEAATPLLIYLHGGVASTKQFQFRDPDVLEEPIFAAAEARGALLLYPFGRQSFGWLKQVAALENVRRMVAQVQLRYHVNRQRVYLGGMSNGGTAAFWYACQRPTGFAGFYALSATPTSALGPLNFRRLSRGAPLYSLNAEDDQVSPFKEVRASYEQHRGAAAQWHFASLPSGGHGFLYEPTGPAILRALLTQLMGPLPPQP